MRNAGHSDKTKTAAQGGFHSVALISAEIAFAALLLYMINQPVDISPTVNARQEPLITIEIPTGNVAVASTVLDMNSKTKN